MQVLREAAARVYIPSTLPAERGAPTVAHTVDAKDPLPAVATFVVEIC